MHLPYYHHLSLHSAPQELLQVLLPDLLAVLRADLHHHRDVLLSAWHVVPAEELAQLVPADEARAVVVDRVEDYVEVRGLDK